MSDQVSRTNFYCGGVADEETEDNQKNLVGLADNVYHSW
jgi:hypothetical protein